LSPEDFALPINFPNFLILSPEDFASPWCLWTRCQWTLPWFVFELAVRQVRENVGKWLMKSDKSKERSFTLSDVKEGASYEFRVSAVNKAGQGPASAASTSAKYGQLRLQRSKNRRAGNIFQQWWSKSSFIM